MIFPRDEKILVQKIIAKDERVLLDFYNKYKKSIFQFINNRINDRHKAEELTQDVFLDFIEALTGFEYKCLLKTFLFTIARNKIVDHIRKKRIKQILFSALPQYFVESLKTVFLDEDLEKKELNQKIKNTLTKLPDDYQIVLRLKYIEGEKVKKIAQKLSLGFKAAESLIFRARQAFIKIFNQSV